MNLIVTILFFVSSITNPLELAWLLSDHQHKVTLAYEHGEIHLLLHHHESDEGSYQVHEVEPIDAKKHHQALPSENNDHGQEHRHMIHVSSPEHYFREVKKIDAFFKNFIPSLIRFKDFGGIKELLRLCVSGFYPPLFSVQFLNTIVLRI